MPAPERPDQVWVADLTYVDTGEGWLYLAGLLDACSRRCVGWQTGTTLEAALVTQAWQKAVRARGPGPGLRHHSDRGVQYASGAMERPVGRTRSHRVTEPPGQLRRQRHDGKLLGHPQGRGLRRRTATTRQAAKLKIFDYIEGFYNRHRLHSSLGYQSPLAFESKLGYSKN